MDPAKFHLWVHEMGGCTEVGKKLDVNRVTVWQWLSGNHSPQAKLIPYILMLADGKLKASDIPGYDRITRVDARVSKAKRQFKDLSLTLSQLGVGETAIEKMRKVIEGLGK